MQDKVSYALFLKQREKDDWPFPLLAAMFVNRYCKYRIERINKCLYFNGTANALAADETQASA
jgi:hypothetical protein